MRWMALGAVAAIGCEPATVCEQAADVDAPALVVGWGEDGFERAIADGEELSPVYGAQGGQHLWLAVETRGFAPGDGRTLLLPDARVPVFDAALIGVDDGETWAQQSWSYRAMDGDAERAELALGEFVVSGVSSEARAQPLLLQVTGADHCGDVLVGEVEIALAE